MRKNTKGHYLVEVSLILPIVIIAILTVGYLIKVTSGEEKIIHGMTDEAKLTMMVSYKIKQDMAFPIKTITRIKNENKDVKSADVLEFRYLFGNDFNNGLISLNTKVRVSPKLPIKFKEGFDLNNKILCRGFIGDNGRGELMSFGEMESDGNSRTVYIFPEEGKRYHVKTCTFVTAHPTQVVLGASITDKYQSCGTCKSGDLTYGSTVYCFLKYGSSYHRANCSTIVKYTVSMEKYMAIDKGYTPCNKCGGG